jgi:hypothetical protein
MILENRMLRAHQVTVLCCVAAIAACEDPTLHTPGGDPSGAYGYVARSGLTPVVSGTVTLLVDEDSAVTGMWELRRVPGSDTTFQVGPQLGSGTLAGRLNASGMVAVDLNPGWADNNVFLAFSATARDLFTGTWGHSTFLGPVAGGPVQLQRLTR